MGPESKIQTNVVNYARSRGCVAIKVGMRGAFGTKGYPDYLFFFKGRACMIEFKAPGKNPTPLQLERQAEVRRAGIEVLVCDDALTGRRWLESWITGKVNDSLQSQRIK